MGRRGRKTFSQTHVSSLLRIDSRTRTELHTNRGRRQTAALREHQTVPAARDITVIHVCSRPAAHARPSVAARSIPPPFLSHVDDDEPDISKPTPTSRTGINRRQQVAPAAMVYDDGQRAAVRLRCASCRRTMPRVALGHRGRAKSESASMPGRRQRSRELRGVRRFRSARRWFSSRSTRE